MKKLKTWAAAAAAALLGLATLQVSAQSANAVFWDYGSSTVLVGPVDLLAGDLVYDGPAGHVFASAVTGPLPALAESLSAGFTSLATATAPAFYTRGELDLRLIYNFQIVGPGNPAVVPVSISGAYRVLSAGTDWYPARAFVQSTVSQPVGAGAYSSFYRDCQIRCDESGTFAGAVNVVSGYDVRVWLTISLRTQSYYDYNGLHTGGSSASAYIDPYFAIDSAWAAANPGYSVSVSQGFQNNPPALAVPEPSSVGMLLAGLAVLGVRQRKNGLRFARPASWPGTV